MKVGGWIAVGVAAVAASFAFGFSWRDIRAGKTPSSEAFSKLVGGHRPTSEKSDPISVFRTNFTRIRAEYVGNVKTQDLKYAGLAGMVASLGDPHTIFMEPTFAKEFALETSANFVGVGARLSPDPLGAKIMQVFEDGPAFKAGIQDRDIVTHVNGKPVAGKDVNLIVKDIRGKEGTTVRLQVNRMDSPKPLMFTIVRAPITAPTVDSHMVPGTDIGYLSISSFSQPTASQFDRHLERLEANRLGGLVIDLRDNGGGLLETALDILSRFLDDKLAVKLRFRNGQEEIGRTTYGLARKFPYPIVILVNEGSASASEIMAGVLRDYSMATLVGEHTYGKSSVQNVFPKADGSGVKITIARYYIPSGEDFARKVDEDGQYVKGGLAPAANIKFDEDVLLNVKPGEQVLGNPKYDNQLRKAIEVIRSKKTPNSTMVQPDRNERVATSGIYSPLVADA